LLYFSGIPFHAINNEEFDQILEVVGRYGPGAKKPYQHVLREKLLYEEVNGTKEMLKCKKKCGPRMVAPLGPMPR
jgi:hypothetical protein